MTEGNPAGSLSSSHWELHRNTLLFSSLLLIICVPGSKPATTQSFLWLSFSDVGFNSLRLIAFFAATYAFIAYILEWRNEPYNLLKLENRLAKDLMVRAEQLLIEATNNLKPVVQSLQNTISDLQNGIHPHLDRESTHTQDEINEIVHRMWDAAINRPHHFHNPMGEFFRNVGRFEQNGDVLTTAYVLENGSKAFKAGALAIADSSCTIVAMEGAKKVNSIVEKATVEAERLREVLECFSVSKGGLRSIVLKSKIALLAFRSESWLRIGAVGFFIPAVVYLTALAHLAGQLDWGHIPSFFDAPATSQIAGVSKTGK